MVKIVSRKSAGSEPVFDIGVERDHNFILVNGLVASNCFNKSHSTAYAYVTFQTAYLKANYGVEYMTALLTTNSGDQDKVKKYLANCQSMELEVEPPDINRSGVEFTPEGKKILFGLSAVKNVGEAAIAHILEARAKDGPFKSLADLCDRVDLRAVNSRTLESLIKCGAFDRINPNRKQLVEHLELLIKWAQKSKDNSNSEQLALFDLTEVRTPPPNAPQVSDYNPKEKLQFEKELLGFYVSDHPLKFAQQAADHLGIEPISLGKLEEQRANAKIKAIVTIAEIKNRVTKKNDPMAILMLEDLEGQAEAVIFPKSYAEIKDSITQEGPVIISGKVDKQDDRTQIIVDKIELIPEYLLLPKPKSQPAEGESETAETQPLEISAAPSASENPRQHQPELFSIAETKPLHFVTEPPESVEREQRVKPEPTPVESVADAAEWRAAEPVEIPEPTPPPVGGNDEWRAAESIEIAAPMPPLNNGRERKHLIEMVVVLTRLSQETAQNGDRIYRLQIKDIAGSAEAIALPNACAQMAMKLAVNAPFLLWGKVERYGGRNQLLVEDIERIEVSHVLVVEVKPQLATQDRDRLKGILQEFSGNRTHAKIPVVALARAGNRRIWIRFGREFWVQDCQGAVEQLKSAKFPAYTQAIADI